MNRISSARVSRSAGGLRVVAALAFLVAAGCHSLEVTNPNVGQQPCDGQKATNYYVVINDANGFNSWFVENGSYARLRELSVAYSLSPTQLRAIGLSRLVRNLRVSVNGRNLITWTKYTGLDPDTHNTIGGGGDPTTFRFDNFNYPNFRTFSGMVEIGF